MKRLLLILSALSLMTQALAQTPSSEQQKDYEAITKLMSTVKELSAVDLSCHHSHDCGALELGSKACGGPSDYVIISKNNRNLSEMEYLAMRSTGRERIYNIIYRVISDCVLVVPHRPRCIDQVCR